MNSSMSNIFLIGMMGSWKSTVGRPLADELDMEFIDTDDELEEITNMKVSDIFSEYGEQRFREMESAFFIEKAKQTNQVFSTGGGIVLNSNNRKVLQDNGIAFLLNASPNTLATRIRNTKKRPLLSGTSNLKLKLEDIWNQRDKHYKEVAKYTINTDCINPKQVLNEIVEILENSDCKQ